MDGPAAVDDALIDVFSAAQVGTAGSQLVAKTGLEREIGEPRDAEFPDSIGGPSRTRPLDPLIKRRPDVLSRVVLNHHIGPAAASWEIPPSLSKTVSVASARIDDRHVYGLAANGSRHRRDPAESLSQALAFSSPG